MAKAEWGLKRLCPNCGTRYYDMRHDPIVCPKCGAHFDAEAVVKTRRVRTQTVTETALGPIVAEDVDPELVAAIASEDVPDALPPEGTAVEVEGEEDAETEGEGDEAAEGEEGEEEEEVLEDASELGEDEDDMAEVIENVDEEEER